MENRIERRKQRSGRKQEYYFDYSLLFIVLFLLGFGLVMIYSASSYTAQLDFNDASHYLKKQLVAVILGLIAMFVVSNIPYQFWKRFYMVGYGVSIGLILLVLTPLGVESHNARRWITIPGLGFNLQPSEVAKLCMILCLAVMVCKIGKSIEKWKGVVVMLITPVPIALLIYIITKNLSSAIILMAISAIMIFVASPKYKQFIIFGLICLVLVTIALLIIFKTDWIDTYRADRILAWRNPEKYSQKVGFQTLQALYAIGSGGVFGKGLGQSMQKLNFLPESQNDMIFSIICEELGLFGAIAIITLFAILIWRMMIIANNATDLFGAMLVVGVMGHIAIQAILNIAVVTNTVPNTGISLPFISYGGSSVIFLLIEVGLVLSVAKGITLRDE